MDFFDAVHNRTSVRSFQPKAVSEADWEKLLRAAMAAPSAVNCQPWDFVVIQDHDTLERLAETLPYAKMTTQAAGAVLVCTHPEKAYEGSKEYAVIDASLACANLLLAATALGLGAVWTAVYPDPSREIQVHRILGIPPEVIILALVPVGYPEGEVKAKDKFKPTLIHREHW